MFYSAQVLSKRGPLGPIWVASWSQRGLKRSDVFNCSLPAAVDSIINPEAPLALRLSGQLLLGLVRLYLRKLQFLEEDAGLALRGLARNAGASGTQVDLPDGGVAPEMTITLQDSEYDPMAQFVGNELFPSFESSLFPEAQLGASIGGAVGGASVTVAQDISELFGSHWTGPGIEEERFDVDGDAMDRRFSMELERLRSQGVEAPRDNADMFFGAAPLDETFSPVMDDEVMAVPPDELFAGPGPTPGRTPLSGGAAPLPGRSDMRVTPASLGAAADLLPDIGGASGGTDGGRGFALGDDVEPLPVLDGGLAAAATEAELAAAMAAEAAGAMVQKTSRQRRAVPAAGRRRRPTVDVQANGQPATTLPSDQIRKLLLDRKPLMARRGLRTRQQRAAQQPSGFGAAAAQAEAARESELYRPVTLSALGPELLGLFGRALTLPGQAAGEGAAAEPRRRRSSRGTVAAEEETAAAAVAAAELAEEEELAGAGAGMTPGGDLVLSLPDDGGYTGGFSDAAPFSAGGYGDDVIEPADDQRAAALAPAGPDEEGEEGGVAGAAAQRSRLLLQPVPSSGELGSTGADSSQDGSGASATASFTKNTALVLEHLRREFAPSTGSKRRHPSAGDLAAGVASLSLDGLLGASEEAETAGQARRGRLEAARWFYESLVLRSTGFVTLTQEEPYGAISITPTTLLAGGRGTPGSAAPATLTRVAVQLATQTCLPD